MKNITKYASIIAFVLSLLGLFYLIKNNLIISKNLLAIAIQSASVVLMIWSRITFGIKSFNASSNTIKEKLVTNGPYKWLRHPIYAAIIYFFIGCLIAYPNIKTLIAVIVIVICTYVRMLLEEKELLIAFKDYAQYSKKVKRIIPFVF
ncbi:isoprenylcysteine carboxylmethyltransferase family protein [Winogradskyella litoriviva]|uniref:Isoprenylcysteine carboxylmethyltransferase family protein n=1 Tax=Winogradskyella litoriviva TaxID=1220182 RepID=A0ABX2E8B6_9FLAO|nr:isoprenylcysteine carboxylmethyltransferase family protein [Winogradskyella litoriviva]NRD24587.1 isoprenylcysteine carboxylmethyltransferase family protein [Winogradskyella litoriviva]